MDDSRYRQVLRAASQTPWAIVPEKLVAIRELLAYRAEGHRYTAEEVEQRIGARSPRARSVGAAGTAVIPIHGVIAPRAAMFSEISGGTGTGLDAFTETLRGAVKDPNVDRIVLDIDSPGGTVDLVPETAAEIRSARASKPVVAVANTFAASAAYWLASQADELVVTQSGEVGSIGVFTMHQDFSAALESEGVKTTFVSAGKHKTELNPYQPLTDEAREALQESVDDVYGMFVRDVARGRGVSADDVRAGFGEGRMVMARKALKLGMVDRIDTLDAVLTQREKRSLQPVAATANFAALGHANYTYTLFPEVPATEADADAWADYDKVVDLLTATP